ncbi:MAG TPA: TrbG/VirB9 family P-type conjugative transfer protein, partial [Steroidobacteraceae bacterium]|nr:TrbG/VirB9 family P-type conjugative transfer protein [Steroidobacteraceae bacterium]
PCSFAGIVPERGAIDGRIRVAPYVADQVYRLRGFVGYQIDLEFEPGESFVGLGAGDLESLTFAAQANHLFLKPRAAGVDTNLTVLTSRRNYHFDYSVSAHRPDPDLDDIIYVLRFTFPPQPVVARESAAALAHALGSAPEPHNLDYWYRGSPELKPVAASDDGVQTRLRFGALQELPAIFLGNDDGSESLVNFTVEGEEVVVHRVSGRLILRRGKLTGCIVNAAPASAGGHTSSGTVTPAVERVVRSPGHD